MCELDGEAADAAGSGQPDEPATGDGNDQPF
jgi:hypothetical protein